MKKPSKLAVESLTVLLENSGLKGYTNYLTKNGFGYGDGSGSTRNETNLPRKGFTHSVISQEKLQELLAAANPHQMIYEGIRIFTDGVVWFITDDDCFGSTYAEIKKIQDVNNRALVFPNPCDLIPGFSYRATSYTKVGSQYSSVAQDLTIQLSRMGKSMGTRLKAIDSTEELAEYLLTKELNNNQQDASEVGGLPNEYVVGLIENGKLKSFYSRDTDGYPSFTPRLRYADFFDNEDEAYKIVKKYNHDSEHGVTTASDGVRRPATDVSRALELSNTKQEGTAEIMVLSVNLQTGNWLPIFGKIQKPTGFVYE